MFLSSSGYFQHGHVLLFSFSAVLLFWIIDSFILKFGGNYLINVTIADLCQVEM